MRHTLLALTGLTMLLAACTNIRGTDDGPPPAAPTSVERAPVPEAPAQTQTYTREEILAAGKTFFGGTTEGLAKAMERVFAEQGEPVAYIEGEEGGGAIIAGLRYGQGYLSYKGGGRGPVFWQGPSIGWDFGGNASKVFTLVYNLKRTEQLFQRYPGVEGSLYVVAGFGLNYLRSGDVVLAPIRTGVGLRAGASIGYLHFTREPSYVPF
ncbi:MAG: DUF1134 domain-containing protein [Stagnimonas sp.]|nr:DUF1134 domain-containing protein [Stagnimonas sp.]